MVSGHKVTDALDVEAEGKSEEEEKKKGGEDDKQQHTDEPKPKANGEEAEPVEERQERGAEEEKDAEKPGEEEEKDKEEPKQEDQPEATPAEGQEKKDQQEPAAKAEAKDDKQQHTDEPKPKANVEEAEPVEEPAAEEEKDAEKPREEEEKDPEEPGKEEKKDEEEQKQKKDQQESAAKEIDYRNILSGLVRPRAFAQSVHEAVSDFRKLVFSEWHLHCSKLTTKLLGMCPEGWQPDTLLHEGSEEARRSLLENPDYTEIGAMVTTVKEAADLLMQAYKKCEGIPADQLKDMRDAQEHGTKTVMYTYALYIIRLKMPTLSDKGVRKKTVEALEDSMTVKLSSIAEPFQQAIDAIKLLLLLLLLLLACC